MKTIMFARKYDPAEAIRMKALNVFEIYIRFCGMCGNKVMVSQASKEALDANPEIIINCSDCMPKEPPTVIAATDAQLREMIALAAKKRAQNN